MPSTPAAGSLLKRYREDKGIRQRDLIDCLKADGYPVELSLLYKYESGARKPNAVFIGHFVKCCGLTYEDAEVLLEALSIEYAYELLIQYQSVPGVPR